jgi:hypothetical protein
MFPLYIRKLDPILRFISSVSCKADEGYVFDSVPKLGTPRGSTIFPCRFLEPLRCTLMGSYHRSTLKQDRFLPRPCTVRKRTYRNCRLVLICKKELIQAYMAEGLKEPFTANICLRVSHLGSSENDLHIRTGQPVQSIKTQRGIVNEHWSLHLHNLGGLAVGDMKPLNCLLTISHARRHLSKAISSKLP